MRLGVGARVAIASSALLLEYAVVGVCFDGSELARRGGWLSHLQNAGQAFTALIVLFTAGCLVHWRELGLALARTRNADAQPSAGWAAIHLGAFALSLGLGLALVKTAHAQALELLFVVVAAAAGVLGLTALLRALFGPAALGLTKVLARAVAAGALLGLLAWQAGVRLQPLWPKLARATLGLSARALGLLSRQEVSVDYATAELALGDFGVEIAPECSGIEGMGLIFVFMVGYIYRFREQLRLARVWPLVPVAVFLAWLANGLRIAMLVAIGAWGAPAVALGGFHSKAGWIIFCAITLLLVVVLHQVSWFQRDREAKAESGASENPTAGYCMPFLALSAVSLLTGALATTLDWLYPLRLVAAAAALYWARPYLKSARGSASWQAFGLGALVFLAWLTLSHRDATQAAEIRTALTSISPGARVAWLSARVLGGVVIVPVVEELAFRGFLQRRLVSRDFDLVPYRAVPVWAALVAALAFGALHTSWWLGALAGAAYSLAAYARGRLSDAIVAHGVTNLLLVAAGIALGRPELFC